VLATISVAIVASTPKLDLHGGLAGIAVLDLDSVVSDRFGVFVFVRQALRVIDAVLIYAVLVCNVSRIVAFATAAMMFLPMFLHWRIARIATDWAAFIHVICIGT
jgi:hypothetical protein